MASLITKISSNYFRNITSLYTPSCIITRNKFERPRFKRVMGTIKHRNLIEADCDSLAARGFLRSQAPYSPAPDVDDQVHKICKDVLGPDYDSNLLLSAENKFNLLNTCFKKIGYSIPNSRLCHITTVNEVFEFYRTPISTTTPYDELKNREDLPPNLYLQPDYIRYDPEADPFAFDSNASAFPHSSSIVTGLKTKQKYKSRYAKPPYHYHNEANFIRNDKP